MARTPRPRVLGAIFAGYFLIVGFIAWQFAWTQTTKWYPGDISRWIYSTYMIVAAVFLVGTGGLGLSLRRSFALQIRELEAQLASGGHGSMSSLPPPLPESPNARDHVDRDIDELLESLSEVEATAQQEVEAMDRGADPVTHSRGAMPGPEAYERRDRLLHRRKFLGRYLVGPATVAAFILGLAGIMLPGVDGFAQTNHNFNTALVLGIGYSWVGVGWYIAATVYALVSARDERGR